MRPGRFTLVVLMSLVVFACSRSSNSGGGTPDSRVANDANAMNAGPADANPVGVEAGDTNATNVAAPDANEDGSDVTVASDHDLCVQMCTVAETVVCSNVPSTCLAGCDVMLGPSGTCPNEDRALVKCVIDVGPTKYVCMGTHKILMDGYCVAEQAALLACARAAGP